MAIRYKDFLIEPHLINECKEAEVNTYSIKGQRTAYKICHSVTKLVYGMKRTMASAQNTIDKNGTRWLSTDR